MKPHIPLLLLLFTGITYAQDKLTFEYDAAGNQIKRSLCIDCLPTSGKTTEEIKEVADLQEDDLQKFFPEDVISYYPNPVKEELFVKWELARDNSVTRIEVFNFMGSLLAAYGNLETNSLTIPFQSYPSGVYIVVLSYKEGTPKSIKIIKQ